MHPRNTEELLSGAQNWLQQAITDLRQHMESFMNAENVSPEELAEALALSTDEITAVLNEDVDNVSLRTFAHVLIANGLVLAIEPVENTPVGNFRGPRHGVNRRGAMPMPPMGGRMPMPPMGGRMPMPPMGGRMPMPPMGGRMPNTVGQAQPRDNRGRFMAKENTAGSSDPYARLSLDALRDIIVRNNWHYEINIAECDRQELIEFLKNKQRMTIGGIPTERQENAKQEVAEKVETTEEISEETVQHNDADPVLTKESHAEEAQDVNIDAILKTMADLFKSNPEAANKFAKLVK